MNSSVLKIPFCLSLSGKQNDAEIVILTMKYDKVQYQNCENKESGVIDIKNELLQ